jgi:hypothetical protein
MNKARYLKSLAVALDFAYERAERARAGLWDGEREQFDELYLAATMKLNDAISAMRTYSAAMESFLSEKTTNLMVQTTTAMTMKATGMPHSVEDGVLPVDYDVQAQRWKTYAEAKAALESELDQPDQDALDLRRKIFLDALDALEPEDLELTARLREEALKELHSYDDAEVE